jgi:hypothetical protein
MTASVNIVALLSLVTFPRPTSEAVMEIFPDNGLLFMVLVTGTYIDPNPTPFIVGVFTKFASVDHNFKNGDIELPSEPEPSILLDPKSKLPPLKVNLPEDLLRYTSYNLMEAADPLRYNKGEVPVISMVPLPRIP